MEGDTLLNNSSGVFVQFSFTPESPIQDPKQIVEFQTSGTVDFESVSSTTLTIEDDNNDAAALVLTTARWHHHHRGGCFEDDSCRTRHGTIG